MVELSESERLDKFDLDWLNLFDCSDWIEPDVDGNECSDALMWDGAPLTCVNIGDSPT